MQKVGVIDIGSNTIKLLIASGERELQVDHTAIEECRISTGISKDHPALQPEAMQRGIEAVQRLIGIAKTQGVSIIRIVATSAVRDAVNGSEFVHSLNEHCFHKVGILTGKEEAELIAFGLSLDPAMQKKKNFFHFDLGGGSLEFNEIRDGSLLRSTSMPLGAVRLTEMFIPDPHQPVRKEERNKIEEHVAQTLKTEAIFPADPDTPLIFTGGSVAISRTLIHGKSILDQDSTSAEVSQKQLELLYRKLASISFEERLHYRFLPRNRADVICTAIIVVLNLLKHCNKNHFQHSLFALRHGIAAKTLRLNPILE